MSDILREVAQDIDGIENDLNTAESLIDALAEAGEDVTALRSDLRNQRTRKKKWDLMLQHRGLK